MSKYQIIKEIHSPARRNFLRRTSVMKGVDDTFQADLVEMLPYAKFNRNNKYILTVIDTFSKYAWAVPVKTKSGKDVTNAMKSIFDTGRIAKNVQTDHGKEFYNSHFTKLMSDCNINHYSTYSTKKAAIVERFNRTLKGKMWFQFSLQDSYKWVNILQDIVKKYNSSLHRTIKMKPKDVDKCIEKHLLETVYNNKNFILTYKKSRFKINDAVRISKYKALFAKGYTPNWTAEIFRIYKVRCTDPVTYLLKDYQNFKIKGSFYEQELQKAQNSDYYIIEKIIRKAGNRNYVKWLGFDDSHNSWIDVRNMS